MNSVTRRGFFKTSIAGAGLLAASHEYMGPARLLRAAEPVVHLSGSDIVALGKSGLKVSRWPRAPDSMAPATRPSIPARARRLSTAWCGTVSTMAALSWTWPICTARTPFVKDVVKGLPRDKYTLSTKIWPRGASWAQPSGGAKAEVDRFRKELDTDYLDICLIHCMQNANWPAQFERIRDELSDLKKKGAVRAVGVSCHDLGALKVAAEHPWVDVIFARVNHKCGKQFSCDGSVEEVSAVLKTARKNGKGVVGMKIFGEGKLVKPEEKDASLKFVFTNELVDAITVGTLKISEVEDTLKRMSQVTRG